ncbi:MAG: signal peptide peptidase SppA [Geobacteraceae bacterium]|nr:signal peptide peptidase SppA [Geobacteraceae bacterium]
MKNKWIWVGIAGTLGFFLLFAISVFIAAAILGGGKRIVVGSGVGLVEVKGMIIDSQDLVKQLNDFRKNDSVKAVVLRIDSPGGVVGPSQEICAEVKKLAAAKKVVVSMGSIAASGGYYIAAPASVIIANPGTITGSIGVLMRFSNLEGLLGKVGMKSFTLKTGKYKDVGSPARTMTDQEKEMLQQVIDNTHLQFVKAVAEGRKLPVAEVRAIADGRIYTGEQAMALKLVDRLGTLQDAIEEAGRLAGIKGEPQIIRPPRKKRLLLDMLIEESTARIGTLARQENEFSVNYELEGAGR